MTVMVTKPFPAHLHQVLEISAPFIDVNSLVQLSQCSRYMYNVMTTNIIFKHAYTILPIKARDIVNLVRASEMFTFSMLRTMLSFEENCLRLKDMLVVQNSPLEDSNGQPVFPSRRAAFERFEGIALGKWILSKDISIQRRWDTYMIDMRKAIWNEVTFMRNKQETVGDVLYWLLLGWQ